MGTAFVLEISALFFARQHSPTLRMICSLYFKLPSKPTLCLPAWDLGNGLYLLDDLNTGSSGFAISAMDDSSPPLPPGASGGSGTNSFPSPYYWFNTNGLWLKITNITTNLTYVNLNNSTNIVYAIWSTTNLLTPWNVETEVWPTNSTVMPFTVPALGRSNLFLMAEDWTGVSQGTNSTPLWWLWNYFGEAALTLTDTNLDSQGANTLLYDYQNGINPNPIAFALVTGNDYVNKPAIDVQLSVVQGNPYYVAVLVDTTNFADANWTVYTSSNISVNLGSNEGWHSVWIGLSAFPQNPQPFWQWARFNLDQTPLKSSSPAPQMPFPKQLSK